jgi:hypothetical protein
LNRCRKLAVSDSELDGFMRSLKRSVQALEGVHKALRDSTAGGLGTADLDNACEDFQSARQFATRQIGEQAQRLADIVGKSKESYAQVDKSLEDALAETGAAEGLQGGGKE